MIHKALPKGLVFHGTDVGSAKSIMRNGLRSGQGRLGPGAYASDTTEVANQYATRPLVGQESRGKDMLNFAGSQGGQRMARRRGKVIGFKPLNPAKKTADAPTGGGKEGLYNPKDLKPVHIQNSYESSVRRAQSRRRGVKPFPDSGPPRPSPTPVTKQPKSQVQSRLQQLRAKRNPLPVSDFN